MNENTDRSDTGATPRQLLASAVTRAEHLRLAMWGAIATSGALLLALLITGLGDRAVELAAGLLVLACLVICLLSSHTSHRTSKAIDRLTHDIGAQRGLGAQSGKRKRASHHERAR